jgi:hypothetical protein
MSKGKEPAKSSGKKEPALNLKEKRDAKKLKKAEKNKPSLVK